MVAKPPPASRQIEGLTDGSAAPILIRLLPTDRPTHGAVGLPCCADRARRQLGLVAKRLSRIPDNSVKPTNHPSNPYSHNSAKSAITIRPVTTSYRNEQRTTADPLTPLISSALDVGPLLKILLVGQDSLRATLKRTQHADLLNRLSVRFQLRPLSREQTAQYIDFQIARAGGDAKIFDDEVKHLIHDFTGGLPRAVNNLAIACLLQATARRAPRIGEEIFQQAAAEFQLP